MNLNTSYLGMNLHSPLVVSACPLSDTLDNIKHMEDAGAAAIVLFSLFEEQLRTEHQNLASAHSIEDSPHFHATLEGYLAHIRACKEAVAIPIIASLNCTSLGSWTEFARQIESAGADALELHIYFMPSDMDMTSEQIETMYIQILRAVRSEITIPVSVKLSPYFTNMLGMARRLDLAGTSGLVLFNRFYQPDLDPRSLRVHSNLQLSTSYDLRLPLHWTAILRRHIKADLAASGGIHTAEDVVKMLMVGAKVTMLASVLLEKGIDYLSSLEQHLCEWLEQNDYTAIRELQGIVSQFNSKDPGVFERAEYLRALTSYKPMAWDVEPSKA